MSQPYSGNYQYAGEIPDQKPLMMTKYTRPLCNSIEELALKSSIATWLDQNDWKHLKQATIVVPSCASAIDWYTRILRFQVVKDETDATKPGSRRVTLLHSGPYILQTSIILAQLGEDEAHWGETYRLFLLTEDVDVTYGFLSRKNVVFEGRPPRYDADGVKTAVFKDPWRTEWTVLANPALQQKLCIAVKA